MSANSASAVELGVGPIDHVIQRGRESLLRLFRRHRSDQRRDTKIIFGVLIRA